MNVLGYGLKKEQKSRIILIGAGKIGEQAVVALGKHRIAYFADNDKSKVGTNKLDIPIIAIEDLPNYQMDYDLVLCTDYYCEIAEQLIGLGIIEFYRFKRKSAYDLERFFSKYYIERYKRIALYGTGKDAQQIMEDLKGIQEVTLYCVIDYDSSPVQGTLWNGFKVRKLEEVQENIDAVLIGSRRYHMAIGVRLSGNQNGIYDILDPFEQNGYGRKNELVVNDYKNTSKEVFTEDEFNERSKQNVFLLDAMNAYVDEVEKLAQLPLFAHVEIETINRCNGICSFCPVNRRDDKRKLHKMSDELYEKIILELEELDYSGRIAPFSNNEPFLDEKIIERTRFMREHLPKAKLHMFTNGTLLTLEKYLQIIELLDDLVIDNYDENLELMESIKEIYQYCVEHPELIEKTSIVLRKPNEILTTRGGEAPNRKKQPDFSMIKCGVPYRQVIIRPTGEISLCCNDPLGRFTLGNVLEDKLIDIWHGKRFQEIRNLLKDGRGNLEHCKHCDYFFIS